ncbi:MAG: aldehyde dehydrogenase family protein [Bacteroidales bacterium]|nr:aldehyde dehydrogenase family protein [Bacteroidales bacterium]MBK7627334.1 aldehyde dehydrogenase family protein [Bacteroidales bacterium]
METEEISIILENQRRFFASGKTLDVSYRIAILKKLRSLILENEQDIADALWKDFHKPEFEVIATESRFVLKELNHTISRLKRWSHKRRVRTPLVHFLSHSYISPQPYGQVLVLSPWNFPFQLAFMPLIGAIAAGNCVVLKVSQQVPAIAKVMEKILSFLPVEHVAYVYGDHTVSDQLLDYKFDYIFFTGSPRIGKHVMQKASQNLTPLSLELGGKNPCVVTADARLDYAAKRIAWGKLINCGQTCVSPDYLLIDKKVQDRFLELITQEIRNFYGEDPEKSNDFARVINSAGVKRLEALMKAGNIVTGGICKPGSGYVSPTIIKNVKPDDAIMQEEIFGPVLPVIGFENIEEIYPIIDMNPKPLATYIFSTSKKTIREFMMRTQSGSASINETVMQIASPYLPYGGIGSSGMGRYHGKKSFETFSNMRSVLVKSNLLDIWLRYPPYSKFKTKIVSFLMK